MTVRSPHLHAALRGFTLGAFAYLLRELEAEGTALPFAFEEHGQRHGPTLYEYRPLVRGFVEERAGCLREREDAAIALEELRREPTAAVYARAHAGAGPSEDDALFRTVLLDLALRTAEACGGFDWDDAAFERVYADLERSLFGERRTYVAVAPLVGLSVGTAVEMGPGIRLRAAADGEIVRHWPEAAGLVPTGFGREADRYCVVEVRTALGVGDDVPDAPGEVADVITAVRLATGAPAAAGPVLLETLDGRPFGIRPVPPIAATQPAGEPSRLDAFRGPVAAELRARLTLADADPPLAEALDRWELSQFQDDPFRSEQLRGSAVALLGATWPLRASVLLEDESNVRERLHTDLEALAGGGVASAAAEGAVRRSLVEVLRHGDRVSLWRALDSTLLGAVAVPARRVAV